MGPQLRQLGSECSFSETRSPPASEVSSISPDLSRSMDDPDVDNHRTDQKDGRLLLRMEVSHLEHASLIGPGGSTVREMREANSVLIHFPESSQSSPEEENGRYAHSHMHLNEVSIRGKLPNVIAAFQKVRSSIPFQFNFLTTFKANPDASVFESIRGLELVFKIDVIFRQAARGGTQIVIRGPQESRTLIGVQAVCSLFSAKEKVQVSQALCINPHSQSTMWDLCNAEKWLKSLVSVAGVTINFPSPRGNNGDKETVTITGSISGVAAAWIILMSMLPVTIRVFIDQDLDYMKFQTYIEEDLQVHYLVPRRERRPADRQYIELKSYEGNIDNICKAYRVLMGNNANLQKFRVTSTQETLNRLSLDFAVGAATEKCQKLPDANKAPTCTAPLPSSVSAGHRYPWTPPHHEFYPCVHPGLPHPFPYPPPGFPHPHYPFPFVSHQGMYPSFGPIGGASGGGHQPVIPQPASQLAGRTCHCQHRAEFPIAPNIYTYSASSHNGCTQRVAGPVQKSQYKDDYHIDIVHKSKDPLHRQDCGNQQEPWSYPLIRQNRPNHEERYDTRTLGLDVLDRSMSKGFDIRDLAEAMPMNPESHGTERQASDHWKTTESDWEDFFEKWSGPGNIYSILDDMPSVSDIWKP